MEGCPLKSFFAVQAYSTATSMIGSSVSMENNGGFVCNFKVKTGGHETGWSNDKSLRYLRTSVLRS